MNCPRCKSEVTAQDKYCPSCGAPTETGKQAAAPRKGAKKSNYEEASTQVLDVDEFRKYMATEKGKASLSDEGQPAASKPGNLAGGAEPAQKASIPVDPGAAPVQSTLSEQADSASSLSPASLKSTGTYEPAEDFGSGRRKLYFAAAVVVVVALLLYKFVL